MAAGSPTGVGFDLGRLLLVVCLAAGCGRSGIRSPEDPPVDADASCLSVCLEAADELERNFGVSAPCTEPEWSDVPPSCEACGALFLESYGIQYEWGTCLVCGDDFRAKPLCGTPPPECPRGTWPAISNCSDGQCGECGPSYTGACEPCMP